MPVKRIRHCRPPLIVVLARAAEWTEDTAEDALMKPTAKSVAAAIGLCWAAYCGPYDSDAWPLAFGMTPQEASSALGMPLAYYAGPPGSELYLAGGSAGVPDASRSPPRSRSNSAAVI